MSVDVLSALAEHEEIITRYLESYDDAGRALRAIHDERLYLATYETFEAYCSDRWGFTDRRARQLMAAAETIDALPAGSMLPANERQAAELRGLDPDDAAEVMRQAHAATNGKPTADAIKTARERRATPPEQPAPPLDLEPEMWADAADRLTKDGTVARWNAERPYLEAVVGLRNSAEEITGVGVDPADLGHNVPTVSRDCLDDIAAAHQWLGTFLTASKEPSV